jgi:hypothetical protein
LISTIKGGTTVEKGVRKQDRKQKKCVREERKRYNGKRKQISKKI